MLLFHFNMGYPLLNEDAILVTSTEKLTPRDPEAEKGEMAYGQSQQPTPIIKSRFFITT